jgi:hypothetical protein
MDQNSLYHRKFTMDDSPAVAQALSHHRTYIYVNLAWYVGFIGLMAVGMFVSLPWLGAQPDVDMSPEVLTSLGWGIKGLTIYGVVMLAFNLYLLTPLYNAKWWTLALVNIGLGMTTCVLAPFCFKLATEWNHPEVKQAFGVPQSADPTKR